MFRKRIKSNRTLPKINLDDYDDLPTNDMDGDILESSDDENGENDDDEEDDDLAMKLASTRSTFDPLWTLPLYSILPSHKQTKVFEDPPEGCRLCVVATNVAETSLTIPRVKYVIDCGRTKVRLYDKCTGISLFTVQWTSKASANQRAGRAGRVAPGHCYRLYSSAVFNDQFEEWSTPEIQMKPVDHLLLQMKSMNIDRVINFPFPSPPDLEQLSSAERRLTLLGALKPPMHLNEENSCKLTPLGKTMSAFPVAPRYAKMLALSNQRGLLPYTVAIVAALSIQEFLLVPNETNNKIWKSWAGVGNSLLLGDVAVLLKALCSAESKISCKGGNMEEYCQSHGLHYKAVLEARKLRTQLTNELNLRVPSLGLIVDPKLRFPSDEQCRLLRQIIMAGMTDQVAYKLAEDELKSKGLSTNKAAYRMADVDDIIYVNSGSVLRNAKPPWVVYQEAYEQNGKVFMRGITAIEPEWLPIYAAPLCHISEPLSEPEPHYNSQTGKVMCCVESTFGRSGWRLPVVTIEYPQVEDKYRWFAKFFLDGLVTPQQKKYVEHLLSPSITLLKSWAKHLLPRTRNIVQLLMRENVDSKEKLFQRWEMDSNFLLSSYLEWLPESTYDEVQKNWPPADKK